jgi:tRNA-dihydrouridine synthase
MYEGDVSWDVFGEQACRLEAPSIANGDIVRAEDAWRLVGEFPWIAGVMIGRGLLRDPFLPAAIEGLELPDDRGAALRRFLDDLARSYAGTGLSSNQVLDKLRDLWMHLLKGHTDGEWLARDFRKLRSIKRYRELMDLLLP